jgi:hypothetical protein
MHSRVVFVRSSIAEARSPAITLCIRLSALF